MSVIRTRLDYVRTLQSINTVSFFSAETGAFHGRKILEGIAFGCLIALEHGIKDVPREAKGKWKADEIFRSLRKKNLDALPSPGIIRPANAQDIQDHGSITAVIEGQPDRRITIDELCAIYVRFHKWNHELNPYTHKDRAMFLDAHNQILWDDLNKIERFVERHFISIKGQGFFCVLRDSVDGQTKVIPLSKE